MTTLWRFFAILSLRTKGFFKWSRYSHAILTLSLIGVYIALYITQCSYSRPTVNSRDCPLRCLLNLIKTSLVLNVDKSRYTFSSLCRKVAFILNGFWFAAGFFNRSNVGYIMTKIRNVLRKHYITISIIFLTTPSLS